MSSIDSVALYKRLLTYVKPYWFYFVLCFIGFAIFGAMEAAMINVVQYFMEGLETRDAQLIMYVPIAVVVIRVIHGIGSFMGNFYISRAGLGVVNDIRKELFAHMLRLPCSFYDSKNSGELVSLIVYNIGQVTGAVTNAVKIALRDGFTIIGYLGLMLYLEWKLTLVFLVLAPLLAGLVSIASKYFRKISRRMQVTMGDISHISNEALQGFRLVKSYNGQRYESERFGNASDENTRQATKYERVSALQGPVFHVVIAANLAVILFLILLFWQDSPGAAIAYLTAAGAIAKPIRQLSSINAIIQRGLAASETIFDVLDLPRESLHQANQPKLQITKGKVTFEQVNFAYDTTGEANANESTQQALRNVSLEIQPGQTVALVGQSGSGKTTLVSLLLRFYDAQSGQISIDGQAINDVDLASLRAQVAFVNQQTTLFNDTIAANIAYGDDLIADQKQLKRAATSANAIDFIENQDSGFETGIGEDGDKLSGGQKQRLAIARAIYKDAPILVLDEATSALDNESEKLIQSALEELQKNRTTIIIAHRLSTIESADIIVAMRNGEIIEIGSHDELITQDGYYASLHAAQFNAQ